MSDNKKYCWNYIEKPNVTIFDSYLPSKGKLKIYEFYKCRELSKFSVCKHTTAPPAAVETQSNKICKIN